MKTTKFKSKNGNWIILAGALIIVLLAGWAIRFQASMTTDLIPGINGAYYPLQVRSILEDGALGIPDFPLLFYADAAVALFLTVFLEQNDAIMLATRFVDLVVPVLIAVPVMLFAFEFSKDKKNSLNSASAVLLVGLIAVGNTSLLRLSGDFQKNAIALPFSLLFLFFLYRSFSQQRKRDYLFTVLFFIITGLTHLGVTALMLTMGGLFAFISLAASPNRKRAVLIAAGLLLLVLLTLTAVYFIDPARIERLLGVVLDPNSLFASLGRESNSGGKGRLRTFFDERLLLGNILGIIGILAVVAFRGESSKTTQTLLWATSLTALLFASPLVSPSWSQRLALMAFLPGLVPLVFLAVRRNWGAILTGVLLIFVLATTFATPGVFSQKTLSIEALSELIEMKDYLESEDTLVFSEHGLEWWVGWAMETEITNRYYLAVENWEDYEVVYSLVQTNPAAFSNDGNQSRRSSPQIFPLPPSQSQLPLRIESHPNSSQHGTLVFEGNYFSLTKIDQQPTMVRGGGQPALEGVIEVISDGWIEVSGSRVSFNESTTFSSGNLPGDSSFLEIGCKVIVWGEWQGLFNREMQASNITLIQTGQLICGVQRPEEPSANQQLPPKKSSGEMAKDTVQLGPLTMITRQGWQAKPLNSEAPKEYGSFDPDTNTSGVLTYTRPLADWLTTIVVHHSALPVEQGPAEIQALHQDKAGYADIGYHFMIGEDGSLYQGREIQIRGAHTAGFNTGTVGVVLFGNFENTDPSPAQLRTLIQLINFLKLRFQITHLAGHQDFNPLITVCPGENLAALLPQLADRTGLIFGNEGYQSPSWDTP